MGKGPLVSVELAPGRFAKMHKQDAIEAGLLPGKKRDPQEDKMRRPSEDKGKQETADEKQTPRDEETVSQSHSRPGSAESGDDLTEIPGVGPSTAEDLRSRGLDTLDDLRGADLGALDGRTRRAIERWRDD